MMRPIEVFFSYAHEDRDLVQKVHLQLAALERNKVLTSWHDRLIPPGSAWEGQIDAALERADIILLFVSPHFFASNYCQDVEVKEAMRRHNLGSAKVIPVLLRPSLFEAAPFSAIHGLPQGGKPVTEWADQDAACLDVARHLWHVATEIAATDTRARTSLVHDSAQSGHVTSGPLSPANDPIFRHTECESEPCRSPNVAVTDGAEIRELAATQDGWLGAGTVRIDYTAQGECETCKRIFNIVTRSIPVQFPDMTCAECGESAFLRYRIRSLTKTTTGYEFTVLASCQSCHGERQMSHSLPSLARTDAIAVSPAGMNVQFSQ